MIKNNLIQIGDIRETFKCGKYIILKETGKNKFNKKMFLIEFINTKTRKIVHSSTIHSKNIKDEYAKNIFNVACSGKTKPRENWQIYTLWTNMLRRCYCKTDKRYKTYGLKGVTVCDDWLCFENFLKDVKKIDGWDEQKFYNKELNLDKDKKIFYSKKTISLLYSLENCSWLSKEENYKIQPNQQFFFEALSPENIKYISHNITEFAKIHNLQQSKVSNCLSNKRKTHKGWKFKKMVYEIV